MREEDICHTCSKKRVIGWAMVLSDDCCNCVVVKVGNLYLYQRMLQAPRPTKVPQTFYNALSDEDVSL